MAYARLDKRAVMRLVGDELLALGGTLLVYMPGEQQETDPTLPVVQLVAIDYVSDRADGGADVPDHAQITITASVWVKRALWVDDAFSLETAVSQVEQAIAVKTMTEGEHFVETRDAEITFDKQPDEVSHARSCSVIISGTAHRSANATLE